MPEIDGVEMSKKIKENELTEHIPIMLLTARTSKEIKYSALKAGAVSYMNKPFDITEIKYQLNNFLNWRSTLQKKYSTVAPELNQQAGILNHSNTFIQKIIALIEENLTDETFTIERLSEELCLSRAQVHRKIKAITGISTSTLVRNIRLEKGHRMLKANSELNVNEVAYACGFSTPSYFTRCFVTYFGQKPSAI
jgi:AraC-like DNA-binding protein